MTEDGGYAALLETPMEGDVGTGNGKHQTVLLSIAGAVLLLMGGYFVTVLNQLQATMTSIDKRVVAIEANRFTSADALRLQQQISELNRNLAGLPPAEWRHRVRAMENFLAREHSYVPSDD